MNVYDLDAQMIDLLIQTSIVGTILFAGYLISIVVVHHLPEI